MTESEEIEYNKIRDRGYLHAAMNVWRGEAKGFGTRYKELGETGLYNGTSFQKKYYPEQYAAHLETYKNKAKESPQD